MDKPEMSVSAESVAENTSPATQKADGPRVFTQDEVDRIVANRVKNMRKDLEALRADMEAARKELAVLPNLQAALDGLRQERNHALVRASVLELFGARQIPSDRMDAVIRLMDLNSVSVDTQGQVVGLEEALNETLKRYPFLLPSPAAENSSPTLNPTNPAQGSSASRDSKWIRDMLTGKGQTFGRGIAYMPVKD